MNTKSKAGGRGANGGAPARRSTVAMPIRFLWYCAGAVSSLLDRGGPEFRQDQLKYATLGAQLVMTAVLAGLAFGYANFVVFASLWRAVLFGVVWGFGILNIDRMLVMGLQSTHSGQVRFKMVLSRVAFAAVLAATMAVPLELRIFRAEIAHELAVRQSVEAREAAERAQRAFPEIAALQKQIEDREAAVQAAHQAAEVARQRAIEEGDGSSGTRTIGTGPIYHLKDDAAAASLSAARELARSTEADLVSVRSRLAGLESERDGMRVDEVQSSLLARTLLAQITALDAIARRSPAARGVVVGVTLLLMLFELLPLIMKLLLPAGTYDRTLERLNAEDALEQSARLNARSAAIELDIQQAAYMAECFRDRARADFDAAMSQADRHPDHAANIAAAAAILNEQGDAILREQIAKAGGDRRAWGRKGAGRFGRAAIRIVPEPGEA